VSLDFRVLGSPSEDNALLVEIDSGQSVERLLFDCGEGCLSEVSFAETLEIDHLFFSHLHMDHVAGFDSFFRRVFQRTSKPNRIWGPAETARILQHRFQGYLWNLHEEMAGSWRVSDVVENEIRTKRFDLFEAFAIAHDEGAQTRSGPICEGRGFVVEAAVMDHKTPTLAFVVREKPRQNVDLAKLAACGLKPGPWLKKLKEPSAEDEALEIDGACHSLDELRRKLLVETTGDSIAYFTDFLLDDAAAARLADLARGCRTIVCEAQYRDAEVELARRYHHMTTGLAATLAKQLQPEQLILIHLSSRYDAQGWAQILEEARAIFPKTRFPDHWSIDSARAFP
jgi:ribonuclease Z